MFFRILKKELKKKKGINLILFLFILLATVFVASSVNNILVVSNATEYCMDKGKVPDKYIYTFEQKGDRHLDDWLDHDGRDTYENYEKNESVVTTASNIKAFAGTDGDAYKVINTILIQSQWKTYMQVFDENQKKLKVSDDEIGMSETEMSRNGLKAGDTITLSFGDFTKTFTILAPIIDPAFGGDYIGMSRYIVSDAVYQEIVDTGAPVAYSYCVDTKDADNFERQQNKQGISVGVVLDRDMFAASYVISMIVAGILIVIGVCLIVISFLILRFTILFTLQRDFREIGIMKAIGIRNRGIKQIYLLKYFALSIVAVAIGGILSVPVSNAMIDGVAGNMMMQGGTANLGVNLVCSVAVLGVILLFCFLSTNRLNHFSVIEAIRSGQNGERFHKKSTFSLYKYRKIRVPFFLAANDIFSDIRRYLVLILTFAIGTILIILPLNTITSMSSPEMGKNFILDMDADFYLAANSSAENVATRMDEITAAMAEKGYDVSLNTMMMYSAGFYDEDEDDISQYIMMQPLGSDGDYIEMIDGKMPVLENEIAMSQKVLEKLKLSIGDKVHMKVNGEVFDMMITGSYQNFMQMGVSTIVSSKFDTKNLISTGSWYLQGKVNNRNVTDKTAFAAELAAKFPDLNVMDYIGAMNQQLGNTTTMLSSVKAGIVGLVCAINVLITVLMMKIFMMGETGQIAMLRSIGFSLRAVRKWQVWRMGIVLAIGVILGSALSTVLNNIVLRPIFGMMGATHMKIQVNALEAYILYPLLLLVVILIATVISTGSVRKMNLMEINNVE